MIKQASHSIKTAGAGAMKKVGDRARMSVAGAARNSTSRAASEMTESITHSSGAQTDASTSPEQYAESIIRHTASDAGNRIADFAEQKGKAAAHRAGSAVYRKAATAIRGRVEIKDRAPAKPAAGKPSSAATKGFAPTPSQRAARAPEQTREYVSRAVQRTKERLRDAVRGLRRTETVAKRSAQSALRQSASAIKVSGKTVKGGVKTIKTAGTTVKRTVKTARKTAKLAERAAQAAQKAAKALARATVKTIKVTAKAVITAVKVTIAAIKSLAAAIAAGGWVAVLIIVVAAVLGAIAYWLFGWLDNDDHDLNVDGVQVIGALSVMRESYDTMVADAAAGYDGATVEIVVGLDEQEVAVLFSVLNLSTDDNLDRAAETMPQLVAAVVEDITIETEETEENGTIVRVTTSNRSAEDAAVLLGFSDEQIELIDEIRDTDGFTEYWEAKE